MSRFRAGAASAAVGAALFGVAVGARGGTALERTGIVELLLVAAGAALVCLAVLTGRARHAYGGWSVALFAALAALTALSIGWSIDQSASFVETGRTFAYLAVFGGAVAAARLAPDGAPTVARGLLLGAVAIAAYGLAARVWPGSFDESEFSGRISQPFDYWNALAGAAAVGLPAALWLGSRRVGSGLARALAFPAAGLLIATLLIAQSRGALIAAVVAGGAWIAIVPLRLRSLVVVAIATAGAVPVTAWALSKDAFRLNFQPIEAREAVAGDFGLWLLATVAALTLAGLAVTAAQARWRPPQAVRVRAGQAVAGLAALALVAGLAAVALSDHGLAGTVSDRLEDFTEERADPLVGGGRLAQTSSSRAGYWGEAWAAFEERPLEGLGAGSFAIARLQYRDSGFHASHAHGFVHQTLSDLGILGLLATLALLATWLAAAARATGVGPRRWSGRPRWDTERAALVALALAAVAYGVQSVADWTWFVPGITVIALVAAGFVAGRGPLERVEPRSATARAHRSPGRQVAAGAALLVALVATWTIWQPVSADRAVAESYRLLDEGDPRAALAKAEKAHDRNPYARDPLYAKGDALAELDRPADALRTFRQVALDNPRDPDPWVRIASFQLNVLDLPREALDAVAIGFERDGHSQTLAQIRDEANARLAGSTSP